MKGATVIIADEHSGPAETVHPGLFFAQSGQESEPIAAAQFDWNADKSLTGPLNDRVFSALQGTDADGHMRWIQVTAKGTEGSSESLFVAAQKSGLSREFLDKAKAVITPGTTIIFTDGPVDPTTQSQTNFQIVVAQKDKASRSVE